MEVLLEDIPSLEEAVYAKRMHYRIGSGAYRTVYRIPGSRWVYKFEFFYEHEYVNVEEFNNFKKYKDSFSSKEIGFPEFVLLNNEVIAAEYIEGTLAIDFCKPFRGPCACTSFGLSNCWQELVRAIKRKIPDLHGRNVKYSSLHKKLFLIDIGSSASIS